MTSANSAVAHHPYDILNLDAPGKLVFMPCPGTKGVSLADTFAQLAELGVNAVVSANPDDELQKLNATAIPELCEQHAMRWFHLPAPDDAAPKPAFHQAWLANRVAILSVVARGGTVAIHCKGGSGRTGMIAALIMLELSEMHVTERIQALRPNALRLPVQIACIQEHFPGYPEKY
ncbi:phosphatase domain-containing putative toxin [Salinibius halmophilus]|uniref:phosphatase domain-containing putative toxin n=1 Tax=Salinibius halmophilus TaxID=1853216 RepID=UPI000E667CAA|nr:tyrosine-protein phosphatase [Salinibius halmophilus]